MDAVYARLELARRFLHVFGPGRSNDFATWAGVTKRHAAAVFDALQDELTPVSTPIGTAVMLGSDLAAVESASSDSSGGTEEVRLLPSGDAFYLLRGAQRELLVPAAEHRDGLWTSRVWPGALLVDGTVIGIWRRSGTTLAVTPWQRTSADLRACVEAEARRLPLPEPVTTLSWEPPTN